MKPYLYYQGLKKIVRESRGDEVGRWETEGFPKRSPSEARTSSSSLAPATFFTYNGRMSDRIKVIREKVLPLLKGAGVLRSSIFGSVARGEERPGSDVDILVELPDGKSLFDLIDLEGELRSALGQKVDLVTYRSLHHLLRDQVLREQIPIL
jgi:predicted nucleotidyltransferase